ncbi:proteasome subunit alpha [Rhodococcus spongiicola]|uniref:Proteasome subunit alpha n=1 Tax=Rhodococcus spongiicola TaxID=2487352 RepID=A0A438AX85_9NOCA|nr:proteasome subunit alpha [Rhodococcus spongiicola]RVW03299.1 proteasome subunit alpha [Rhodococcus spongiicola]
MTLPYYASAEQIMRDRSELARKGIARGRSVIVLTFADGVLFVAENPSTALHKVSELYDRLGFAAVGKYNEFENLRRAGIVQADIRGYSYDRRDVTGRSLANGYAQTLGTIFTEQPKPYEVEICVAEVGPHGATPHAQLYRITYDGSIVDEQHFVVMGGSTEPITTALRESYRPGMELSEAVAVAVKALQDGTATSNGDSDRRTLGVSGLEVAVLDQSRPRRAFRRITGAALEGMLPPASASKPRGGTKKRTAADDKGADPGDAPESGDAK